MEIRVKIAVLCIAFLSFVTFAAAAPPTKVTLLEAKLLIQATPHAHAVRAEKHKIAIEVIVHGDKSDDDYFYLAIYNATRKGTVSTLAGRFIVNKHTADVWEDGLDCFIRTLEMQEFQTTIREARGITKAVLKHHRSRSIYNELETWKATEGRHLQLPDFEAAPCK